MIAQHSMSDRLGRLQTGQTVDTAAVNRAIAAAGGTVRFPAGVYACHSIRLKNFVTLYLEPGATVETRSGGRIM
jgi:polygalacturonase